MRMQGAVIFLAFALFVVWEERQGRWSIFINATTGNYYIQGTRKIGSATQFNQQIPIGSPVQPIPIPTPVQPGGNPNNPANGSLPPQPPFNNGSFGGL